MPTTNPKRRLEVLFTITNSLVGNHCWVKMARAGCLAITETPKARRPISNAQNPEAHP